MLLGATVDFRASVAHVVPLRPDFGPFIVHGAGFALTYDDPTPARIPNATWSIDGDAATLEPGPAIDEGMVYVDALHGGATTLHAYVGPPVDEQIDLPIVAYRSLSMGCTKSQISTALRFTADGVSVSAEASSLADLWVRGSSCGTPNRRAIGIVSADGFVFVPTRTLADFATVPAAAWHTGGTTIAGFATYGTLLSRLRDGRILKFFFKPGGKTFVDAPYIIASIGDEFPDIIYRAQENGATSRRLPDRIRIPAATPRLRTCATIYALKPKIRTRSTQTNTAFY